MQASPTGVGGILWEPNQPGRRKTPNSSMFWPPIQGRERSSSILLYALLWEKGNTQLQSSWDLLYPLGGWKEKKKKKKLRGTCEVHSPGGTGSWKNWDQISGLWRPSPPLMATTTLPKVYLTPFTLKHQPRGLYAVKFSFQGEGEIVKTWKQSVYHSRQMDK